jgi:hypothetical protein
MRLILIAASAAFALFATGSSHAQDSFFNKRYCAIPGGSASGSGPDCSYNTWEQCRASVNGSKYCSENPNWRPDAQAARRRGSARE